MNNHRDIWVVLFAVIGCMTIMGLGGLLLIASASSVVAGCAK